MPLQINMGEQRIDSTGYSELVHNTQFLDLSNEGKRIAEILGGDFEYNRFVKLD